MNNLIKTTIKYGSAFLGGAVFTAVVFSSCNNSASRSYEPESGLVGRVLVGDVNKDGLEPDIAVQFRRELPRIRN